MGQVAHFYLTHDSPYEVAAFTVDAKHIQGQQVQGLALVPFEEILESYPPDCYCMLVALGYRKVNEVRAQKYNEAKAKGYELISYVSTRSVMWGDTKIGENCFLGVNCTLRDDIHLAPRTVVGAGATVVKDTVEDGVYTGVAAKLRSQKSSQLRYFTKKYEEPNSQRASGNNPS